jgi:hypothetical protein
MVGMWPILLAAVVLCFTTLHLCCILPAIIVTCWSGLECPVEFGSVGALCAMVMVVNCLFARHCIFLLFFRAHWIFLRVQQKGMRWINVPSLGTWKQLVSSGVHSRFYNWMGADDSNGIMPVRSCKQMQLELRVVHSWSMVCELLHQCLCMRRSIFFPERRFSRIHINDIQFET